MAVTLHLMTQRGQPYGSVRRCCERCGLMMVARPAEFWRENVWVDDPKDYKHWPAVSSHGLGEVVTCDDARRAAREAQPGDSGRGDGGGRPNDQVKGPSRLAGEGSL